MRAQGKYILIINIANHKTYIVTLVFIIRAAEARRLNKKRDKCV